jgi:hypothetical protein
MAAQEVVERLRTDPAEEGNRESEDVSLVVQLTRLMSLFAIGKYMRSQSPCRRRSTRYSHRSLSSTRAPQITIADARITGRTRATRIPRNETCDGG